MALVLAIRLEADDYRRLHAGGDYRSLDRFPDRVRAMLDGAGLPNPTPFVSVGAFIDSIPPQSCIRAYGTVSGYLHLDRVLADLVLVAPDDIQDAAFARRTPALAAVAGDTLQRIATLERAARGTSSIKYAEARLARSVVLADFQHFDVSGDFLLNLEQRLGK